MYPNRVDQTSVTHFSWRSPALMHGSRDFRQWGSRSVWRKSGFFFVCFFVISLFYRSQMVNFKEIYHFSRFQGGPTISVGGGGGGGLQLFPRGGGLQLLIPYIDQALISVQALGFDLVQLTCQKRFDCRNAILWSSAILLGTSYSWIVVAVLL